MKQIGSAGLNYGRKSYPLFESHVTCNIELKEIHYREIKWIHQTGKEIGLFSSFEQ